MEIKTKYEIGQKIFVVGKNDTEVYVYADIIKEIAVGKNGLFYITDSYNELKEDDIILYDCDSNELCKRIKDLLC